MLFFHQKPSPTAPIYNWLRDHADAIRRGNAVLDGQTVDEGTHFRQYEFTVSLLIFTVQVSTVPMLPSVSNRRLRFASWKYSLVSPAFGWWSVPWGPVLTLCSLLTNITGGKRQTAGSLLAFVEWGYRIPPRLDVRKTRKQLLALDESAVKEIERIRRAGNHARGLAVRVRPAKWANADCCVDFRFPVSNGREWHGKSQGIPILIHKKHAKYFAGMTLFFVDDRFTVERR
jgi:Fe-S cluster assembly iron-binding protein IscA